MPGSKKEMRSFFRKINIVRKFITGFTEIVKPLNEMMKKDAEVEWNDESKESFSQIKKSISEAPVLTSPDYTLPFYIYSFSSLHFCVVVLTQRKGGDEKTIASMSSPFKNAEVTYSTLEKQVFALVRAVKKFIYYILRSKIYAIVPDKVVKLLLMQTELGERRGKWMTILQDFDLEMHPMRLVRGQGLSQVMAADTPHIQCQQYTLESFTQDP